MDGTEHGKGHTKTNKTKQTNKPNKQNHINKGFSRYIGQQRKAKENVPPADKWQRRELVTRDMEKAEVLNFFASPFTTCQASHVSVSLNLKMRAGGAESLPL